MRREIKQDLSPDHNVFDNVIWGVLENKTNATSHPNIGSLKTVFGEEWNKISEELILKASKSFRRSVRKIIAKNKTKQNNNKKMMAILSKFTVFIFVCFVLRHINLIGHLMLNQVKEK